MVLAPLRRKGDFRSVFQDGKKFSSSHLVIFTKPNGMDCCRLGLAVGKKTGNAVVRNRLRRRLREAVRQLVTEGGIFSDIVIVSKNQAAEMNYQELKRALARVLLRRTNENNSNRDSKAL